MKIYPEHFQELSKRINKIIDENPTMKDDYILKGYSMMRYRWDLFHKMADAERFIIPDNQLNRIMNRYLMDDQIDTALKRITGTK